MYFYYHNRLRNTLCSPEELNRQKTLGRGAGEETFSISSWAENTPWARAGLLQTFLAKKQEAQAVQSSSTWCWGAAPAIAWGQWDSWQRSHHSTEIKVTSCFPMAVLGHSMVLYNYVLGASTLSPWFSITSCALLNRDCKHPANRGRRWGRTILCRPVAGSNLQKLLYVTTSSLPALSPH